LNYFFEQINKNIYVVEGGG